MLDYSTCSVGIDLGDRKSVACIYSGGVAEYFEFAMTPEAIAAAFPAGKFKIVALEAGAQSSWVARALEANGYKVVIANPRKLKAISTNHRKSDKNDALMLAKLVWTDSSLLFPVSHRSERFQLALSVMRARDTIVRGRTQVVNTLRSLSKGMGVRLPKGTTEGAPDFELLIPESLQPATNGLVLAVRAQSELIKTYDGQLKAMCTDDFPDTARLLQVRGVGPVTALAFVLTLESPSHFPNGRTAAAYLGLAPRRDQSGMVDKELGISKVGNSYLRWLLVQCAHYVLGPFGVDCDLRRWARAKLATGGKRAKKRIVTAVARKLCVLLFHLWKSGETWAPLFNETRPAAPRSGDAMASHEVSNTSASKGVVFSAERPNSVVESDPVAVLGLAVPCEGRPEDRGTPSDSDSIMHREPNVPNSSANRSLGHGTTAKKPKEKQVKQPPAPQRPKPGAPSNAAGVAEQTKQRNSVAPKSPPAGGKGETLKTAAFEGVIVEPSEAPNKRFPKQKAQKEARSPFSP